MTWPSERIWWDDVEPTPREPKTWTDKQGRTWVRNAAQIGDWSVIEHRDGIVWLKAPKPRGWHRCTPQTRGWVGEQSLDYIERCACGARRRTVDGPWTERNSR